MGYGLLGASSIEAVSFYLLDPIERKRDLADSPNAARLIVSRSNIGLDTVATWHSDFLEVRSRRSW